jgi:multiple sugar transport system ATP-binding protein
LYRHPANVFVAEFIGSPAMNLFTLPITDGHVMLGDWRVSVERGTADAAEAVVVGIRPEHFTVASVGVQMQVDVVEELGADAYLYGRIVESGAAAGRPVIARTDGRDPPPRGACLHLRPELDHVHFFGADGRRLS